MRIKAFLRYFIHILLIIAVVCLKEWIAGKFQAEFQVTYQFRPEAIFVDGIFCILIGILLGGDHLIQMAGNDGRWNMNWIKFLCMGVPSLLFSISYGLIYFIPDLGDTFVQGMAGYSSIFQIALGYIIVTSFIRDDETISLGSRTLWDIYNRF